MYIWKFHVLGKKRVNETIFYQNAISVKYRNVFPNRSGTNISLAINLPDFRMQYGLLWNIKYSSVFLTDLSITLSFSNDPQLLRWRICETFKIREIQIIIRCRSIFCDLSMLFLQQIWQHRAPFPKTILHSKVRMPYIKMLFFRFSIKLIIKWCAYDT